MKEIKTQVSFLKSELGLDWGLLPSFLAVARTGSLSSASALSRKSVPSLSRHMTQIEEQIGERLFVRGEHGFELTKRGRNVLERVERINDLVRGIDPSKGAKAQQVKISAGSLTSRSLAQHFASTWNSNELWTPALISSGAMQDISRREVDIGIRNVEPSSNWLASQNCGKIRYATCMLKGADPKGFVGFERPYSKMALWIEEHCDVMIRVSDSVLGLPFLKAGQAKMLLPIFAIVDDPELEIVDIVDSLEGTQWLVTHEDRRHEAHIRKAIRSVQECLKKISEY